MLSMLTTDLLRYLKDLKGLVSPFLDFVRFKYCQRQTTLEFSSFQLFWISYSGLKFCLSDIKNGQLLTLLDDLRIPVWDIASGNLQMVVSKSEAIVRAHQISKPLILKVNLFLLFFYETNKIEAPVLISIAALTYSFFLLGLRRVISFGNINNLV